MLCTASLRPVGRVCASCVHKVATSGGRLAFWAQPGAVATLLSAALLAVALIDKPEGLLSATAVDSHSAWYLAAAVLGSSYIWWSALRGVFERDFTADIPVSVATIAALSIGQYAAAAVVAVLLLAGGLLEDLVAARANRAVDALSTLLPGRVTVRRDGTEVEVALDELAAGDRVLVRPGQRLAVDGEVVAGGAPVNQAAITGESLPRHKGPGDEVFAGTLAVGGALEVRATKVGGETTLGQIRRMVADAQRQKAPVERTLDRYAKLYTPAALVLAGLLWLVTGDPLRAITMLIVFCPCVMVLATPTALVASIGNAALRGSLVKQGSAIEALEKVDTVCFDKTGTLTLGEPRVIHTLVADGLADAEVLRLAASAEKFSEHPLARAVVAAAHTRGLAVADPESFEALPGLGVRAQTGGQSVLVGRAELLSAEGVRVSPELRDSSTRLAGPGVSVVVVAAQQEPAGLLVIEDTVRGDAVQAVASLNALGMRTVLISGDNDQAAQRIGESLGIREVHSEVLPARKAELVRGLQAHARAVSFVGDGVNDGPALAVADVGIAMGRAGTDLAVQTADVTLLADELIRLPQLFSLARAALTAIRQNLAFSLAVLAFAVALTVPGVLTPATGALLHELSSIPVIANSARLIRRRL